MTSFGLTSCSQHGPWQHLFIWLVMGFYGKVLTQLWRSPRRKLSIEADIWTLSWKIRAVSYLGERLRGKKKPSMYEGQSEMRKRWMLLGREAQGMVRQLKTSLSKAFLPHKPHANIEEKSGPETGLSLHSFAWKGSLTTWDSWREWFCFHEALQELGPTPKSSSSMSLCGWSVLLYANLAFWIQSNKGTVGRNWGMRKVWKVCLIIEDLKEYKRKLAQMPMGTS